ncbi:MAG TPA: hypothetical protein VEK33_18685 [Terriglobales bacterium]|nr:hypothetical protein [Terriglobales bacterium]
MADNSHMREILDEAIAEVFEAHLPRLREALGARVLELQPEPTNLLGAPENPAEDLLKVILLIHAGTSQKEILRALLEGTSRYCGRAALFVVKAGSAMGWQGRAFQNDNLKDFSLDVSAPLPARALESKVALRASIAEMDPKFISQFGPPAEDEVLLFPLPLKDKIAALVYADAGTGGAGKMDAAALELLVAATSAWLEVASLRKQAAKEGTLEAASEAPPPAPVPAAPSYSDPFAGHAPTHIVSPRPEAAPPVMTAMAPSGTAAAAAPAKDEFAEMSVQDAEIHRKAQRFARLLMDEIKLYNQAKLAEGRKNKDLYDRLKDDIEKSRSTYHKRYGNTAAASKDYFVSELIRCLVEDDVSLLGPNFRR